MGRDISSARKTDSNFFTNFNYNHKHIFDAKIVNNKKRFTF